MIVPKLRNSKNLKSKLILFSFYINGSNNFFSNQNVLHPFFKKKIIIINQKEKANFCKVWWSCFVSFISKEVLRGFNKKNASPYFILNFSRVFSLKKKLFFILFFLWFWLGFCTEIKKRTASNAVKKLDSPSTFSWKTKTTFQMFDPQVSLWLSTRKQFIFFFIFFIRWFNIRISMAIDGDNPEPPILEPGMKINDETQKIKKYFFRRYFKQSWTKL